MKLQQEGSAGRKKLEEYSYQLNHNIGKGYSSQVFKGRHDETNQPIAIKVIDMRMIKGEVHKNLLASEIEVLKALKNSQNIIELYDIYNSKNNTYIITELCDGGDLSKLISSKKSLLEHEAVDIMNQIINGYSKIYQNNVVHRDLKPANIFLKSQQVKIADFGFAMKTSEGKKYSSYNVGSPIYMPPEALNDNKYSFKSDIWALGVIFYEMLVGKTPWKAKTEKELGRQLLSIPIKNLLPKNISQSSAEFLTRTLQVSIHERMSPEELSRFKLTPQKGDPSIKNILNTRNNIISSNFNSASFNSSSKNTGEGVSLNRMTVNTPKTMKKFTYGRPQEDTKCVSLPKTAATINNRTQKLISPSHQAISASISKNFQNSHPKIKTATETSLKNIAQKVQSAKPKFDRKAVSKQLLSQIHFCRFLYKLIMRMEDKIEKKEGTQTLSFQELKENMHGLIIKKLKELNRLEQVSEVYRGEYRQTADYTKIAQIIEQYQTKYQKDLSHIHIRYNSLEVMKQELTRKIVQIHSLVCESDLGQMKQQVIVLDYLVTLRQLLSLIQNYDLDGFHTKAKMEAIVEGAPAKNITKDHLNAITNKLKTIRLL